MASNIFLLNGQQMHDILREYTCIIQGKKKENNNASNP